MSKMPIDRLRSDPVAFLPALLALAMASMSLPVRAEARLLALCSGDEAPLGKPGRDCDQACHSNCSRHKKPGSLRGF